MVCDAVGINYWEYAQYLMTYKTERDLLNVVERTDPDADTSLLRFCRAALAVNHNLDVNYRNRRGIFTPFKKNSSNASDRKNADRQATINIAWRRQMGL